MNKYNHSMQYRHTRKRVTYHAPGKFNYTVNRGNNALKKDRNKLTAFIRLISLASISSGHIIIILMKRLFLFNILKSNKPGIGAKIIQKWARASNRALNVKVHISGTPPETGTMIVSNHRSYVDITALGETVPLTFLAKKEVRDWPIIGFGCTCTDVVFVDRESRESRKKSKDEIEKLLKKGVSIVIFPEGTSHEGPGTLPFKPGSFVLAAENDIPIMPVAIEYNDSSDAWTGDQTFYPHFMNVFSKNEVHVHIAFGETIKASNPEFLREKAWTWIDKTCRIMSINNLTKTNA